MDKHDLGEVTIQRIAERGPLAEPMFTFFPNMSEDYVKANEHWLAPNHYVPETRSILFHFHTWVVRTRHHTILVDTCNGNCKSRPNFPMSNNLDTPYLERLKAAGVNPEDVDFVFCTHLHSDHVGWNTRLENGRWVPTFPNAKYLMSRLEHDTWETRSKDPARPEWQRNLYADSVLPVVEARLATLVDGVHAVDDHFTILPAPGHTPGNYRADVVSGNKSASFCGDMLHTPLQLDQWEQNTRACEDKVQAAKSRYDILSFCAERGGLLLPMHFGPPYATYVRPAPNDRFKLDWVA
jgi:glyoxylase-like metal-dependent hydrolase (beta-lactamase superfamily II)